MSRSPRSSDSRFTVILVAAVALGLVAPARATRADEPGPSANLLERERIDVAILAATGPDGSPRILVVDPPADGGSVADVRALARDPGGAWTQAATAGVRLPAGSAADRTPWLVGLGDDRFALVAPSIAEARTAVIGLRVRTTGTSVAIEEGGRAVLDAVIDDGGAADADGDGVAELVLASASTTRQGGTCQGSRLWVLDPSMTTTRAIDVPDRRLAAGATGRFDDVPGDELAVYANPNCPAGPDLLPELRLIVIRLADGVQLADRPVFDAGPRVLVAPPVRVPMTDDRDALLAHVPGGLAVIDPHDGWSDIRVATELAIPLGAVPAGLTADSEAEARVAWLEPSIDGRGTIGTEFVRRTSGGDLDTGPATVMWSPNGEELRWSSVVQGAVSSAIEQSTPPALLADVQRAGCPDLILPAAQVRCADGSLVPGPAWLATRPLGAYPTHEGRVVLVAASLGPPPGEALPTTPGPWAGGLPGRWRHGAGPSFLLAEVAVADLDGDGPRGPVTVDRDAGVGPTARITALPGTRVLLATSPLIPDEVGPAPAPDPVVVLAALRRVGARGERTVVRVPVEVPADPRPIRASVERVLPRPTRPDGTRTLRWAVQAIAIDDRGELGRPVGMTVRLDVTPPGIWIEPPSLTPVWPFPARLTGIVEPGATISAVGGARVDVRRDGTFAIETTLVPWPQAIEVIATDAFGNEGRQTLTVVGGFDYRTLPWAPIVAVIVIAGVIVSGFAGRGRRPGASPGSGRARPIDDGPVAELVELSPGDGLRPDP